MEHREILVDSWKKTRVKNNLILHFNYLLDKKSNYFSLNENALDDLIEQLDHLVYVKDVSYWLTMARINELALLCTENYANNNELTLVGDLLLNPRLILVHIRGENRPVVKKRHTLLTEQFRFAAETPQGVIEWLKTETCLEIKTQALLPHLHQRMKKSGFFRDNYFESLELRKIKIAQLTGFLSNIGPTESADFCHWLKKASPSDREFLKSKLCRYNLDLFIELGYRIRNMTPSFSIPNVFPAPAAVNQNGEMIYLQSASDYLWPIRANEIK